MSLILEALKKSEAERRIGQAPGLSTPMPRLGRRRRSRWPAALAITLVVSLLGASAAYWFATREAAPNVAATPAAAPSPAATPPVAATAASTDSAPLASPAAPPRPTSVATPAPDAATKRAPVPQDPAFVSIERESIALPASQAAPDFVPPSAPAPIVPVADSVVAQTAPTPALEALPRLADLPAGQRDALPPLKLSMHVYTDDPATRFVLIDGRRLGEGAELGKALRLAQIRRDGAVLDFDGTRFILPRP